MIICQGAVLSPDFNNSLVDCLLQLVGSVNCKLWRDWHSFAKSQPAVHIVVDVSLDAFIKLHKLFPFRLRELHEVLLSFDIHELKELGTDLPVLSSDFISIERPHSSALLFELQVHLSDATDRIGLLDQDFKMVFPHESSSCMLAHFRIVRLHV